MRKQRISSCRRYLKYIVLTLLFYPLSVLGAQGQVSVKGQSIPIKEITRTSLEVAITSNLPSTSVVVPVFVPLIITDAPGMGSPVADSVTTPIILCLAAC